jgi:hypothetical protein
MLEDPLSAQSLIAAPAILTNACAIMQKAATARYSLAIAQWRDFRAWQVAGDDRLSSQYTNPQAAVALANRRVRLQLGGLNFLNAAVVMFAAATVIGIGGVLLVQTRHVSSASANVAILTFVGIALLSLGAAATAFLFESACGRALLRLHQQYCTPAIAAKKRWSIQTIPSERSVGLAG